MVEWQPFDQNTIALEEMCEYERMKEMPSKETSAQWLYEGTFGTFGSTSETHP